MQLLRKYNKKMENDLIKPRALCLGYREACVYLSTKRNVVTTPHIRTTLTPIHKYLDGREERWQIAYRDRQRVIT